MRVASSASWRLEVASSDLADVALFVRDAVGLEVSSTVDAPPPLSGAVPDRRNMLSDQERVLAAGQWLSWWQQIIGFEFGIRRAGEGRAAAQAGPDHARSMIAERERVGDPPEFAALADLPQLRAAVRAIYDDALRCRPDRTPRTESRIDWAVIKRAVDDVAFDRHVPVDTLNGVLVVLPVVGLWWRRVAPGQALCSAAAASHAQSSYDLVYDVFASGLDP